MIPIKRTAAPPVFASNPMAELRSQAQLFYDASAPSRRQSKFPFERYFKALGSELLDSLRELSHDKCAYCETPFSLASPVVNAFRPYEGVEESSGEYLGDHYWAQAFEWSNFLACCHVCARHKGRRFPVLGTRAPAFANAASLHVEQPLLLDPCTDALGEHLVFMPNGQVAGRTDRGRQTIEILGLGREELVRWRAEEAERLVAVLRKAPDMVQSVLQDHQPFAAVKRQMWAAEQAKGSGAAPAAKAVAKQAVAAQQAFDVMRANVSTEAQSGLEHYRARARFIERVQIHNFLSIERLDLDLSISEADRAPCFAVLGDNAVGKSSVLKAIALALGGAHYAERLALRPLDLLRIGADAGHVSVWISGFKDPTVMQFKRRGRQLQFEQAESRALVLGYGSSRLLPTGKHRPRRGMKHAKIDNLFDPFLPLADAQSWLVKAPPEQFDEAALRIRQLLLLPDSAGLVRTRGKQPQVFVEFKPPARSRAKPVRTPFDRLSDGYQSMLGFAADLMEIMFGQGYKSMGAAQGVVLVDELGNHLHPRWRMQIVGCLREAFPNVQFVFSTHDPLCLRGMRTGEAVVLQLDAQRKVYAVTDLPSISGLRVDQLLRSEHFGLGSTVDPELQQDYERYLALKREATPDAAELARLAERLFDTRVLAASPQERAVLEYMDEARQRGPANAERNLSAAQLNEEAKGVLRALLDKSAGTTQ